MCNRAVEHNVVAFSELSFAVCWQGRLVLQITVIGNYGKLLPTAAMVDNLVEGLKSVR